MPATGGATWIASALLFSVFAGPGGPNPARKPDIRMDVDLVLVPVTVMDRSGASVTGLDREHFRIYEDKVQQPIVSFTREEAPVSVGVVFDLSGSMKDKIDEATAASRALFRKADDHDEAFLITFSGRPEVRTAFTSDFSAVQQAIAAAKAQGSTALVDAVYLALTRMRQARNAHKALVVISDGLDNHSRYSRGELRSLARESDVQIYTVGIFQPARNKKAIEMGPEREGLAVLEELSRDTGGLHFSITGTSEIPRVAERIGTALHNVYVIGYRPPAHREGYRRIQVKATPAHVRVHSRPGYYAAPSAPAGRETRILRP